MRTSHSHDPILPERRRRISCCKQQHFLRCIMLAFIVEYSSSLFAFSSSYRLGTNCLCSGCYLASTLCLLSACLILGFETLTASLNQNVCHVCFVREYSKSTRIPGMKMRNQHFGCIMKVTVTKALCQSSFKIISMQIGIHIACHKNGCCIADY